MRARVRDALLLLAAGVAVNVALAFTKLYVGLSANSLTIMLDAINSFFDIVTCIVTVIAFCVLLMPRSKRAPHGYGRSEYLASFVVAVVSAVVGGIFFIRSLNRMAMPEPVYFGVESCALIATAIPVKLGIGLAYHFVNKKKLRSKAISAIALDSFLDAAITTASLISLVVSSRVDYAVDAIFGIALSVVIMIFAVKTVADSVRAAVVGDCPDVAEAIKEAVSKQQNVESVREISVHDYGFGEKIASVIVTVRKGATLEDVDEMRREIARLTADALAAENAPRIDLVAMPCEGEERLPSSAQDERAEDISDGAGKDGAQAEGGDDGK